MINVRRLVHAVASVGAAVLAFGAAAPAQASNGWAGPGHSVAPTTVTAEHDTGQITFKTVTGTVLMQVGYDGLSWKYPGSGTTMAHKPQSIVFHNFNGTNDAMVCNDWYGNDNHSAWPGLSEDTLKYGNVPTGCNGSLQSGVAVLASVILIDDMYTGSPSNPTCFPDNNDPQWNGCPPPASAGPGGTGNLHPDWNFGMYLGNNNLGTWSCYAGVRIAIGGGANQNVTKICT